MVDQVNNESEKVRLWLNMQQRKKKKVVWSSRFMSFANHLACLGIFNNNRINWGRNWAIYSFGKFTYTQDWMETGNSNGKCETWSTEDKEREVGCSTPRQITLMKDSSSYVMVDNKSECWIFNRLEVPNMCSIAP